MSKSAETILAPANAASAFPDLGVSEVLAPGRSAELTSSSLNYLSMASLDHSLSPGAVAQVLLAVNVQNGDATPLSRG